MENGHRRSLVSAAPTAAELRLKLRNLVIRHEKMKVAYHQLKSQIDAGLLQAEEVFASLAIPLMKLVGLKTVEMAGEGRFTTIIINSDYTDGSQRNELIARRRRSEQDNLTGVLEEESYGNIATKAGKELIEKQQRKLIQLVQLLRQIETQVNSHQDDILHTLDRHRISLHRLFQKAIYFVCALHSQNQNTFIITKKLLETIYKNVSAVLGIVEDGVQDLMTDLSEEMCNPMVEYVRSLKDDIKNGTFVHLLTIVREMEKMMKDGRLELEDARKKIQMAEEGKTQALSKLEAAEERLKRMMEDIRSLPGFKRGKLENSSPHKGSQRNELIARRRREQDHLTGVLEEESYGNIAARAGKELIEKQQRKLIQLVQLLRKIETQVNSHQDDILHTLDSHRISLHTLFQKAIYFVCALHSQNQNTFMITKKLLETIYKNVSAVLGIVEDGVQDLMRDLSEEMCNPMVEYVKSLKDDIKNGTFVHLLTIVREMEKMMKDGRLELEDARKKVQMAEEGKTQALSKLEAAEERVKRMMEHIRCLPGFKRGKLENSSPHKGSQRNELIARRRREQDHLTGVLEEESYGNIAARAGKELIEKQQRKLIQLVQLLRKIETQVNSHQDDILHTLDSHRISLHTLFHKAVYFVCTLHSQNQNTFMITKKLLETIYKNVSAVLGIVEDGVQDLMRDLSEEMCNPMVEYVKSLKDDIKNGTFVHLLTIVREMEKMMKDGRLELEDARKKVQMAEEGKTQALSKLEAAEERVKRMMEHIRCLPGFKRGKLENSSPHKLLGMEEEQGNDDKLLLQLLKKRRKYQAPESPMGHKDLHYFNGIKEHNNSTEARPSFGQRPIKMNTTRVLSPQTDRLHA